MRKAAVFLPVLAGFMWGSSGIFVRTLSGKGMTSPTIISARVVLAVLILFVCLFISDRSRLRIRLRDIWIFMGSSITGILGLNFCYNAAVVKLSLSLAAILLSTAPFFALFLSALLFRERITAVKIGCLFMAVAGCVMASGVIESSAGVTLSVAGILSGVAAAVFFALYGVFSRLATNRGYSTFTIIFYSMLIVSVVLIPMTDYGALVRFVADAPVTNGIFSLVHSLMTSVLPYALYSLSLVYMENGRVAILAGGAEPAAAFVFGIVFYSEIPTMLNLAGLALTIAALTIMCLPVAQGRIPEAAGSGSNKMDRQCGRTDISRQGNLATDAQEEPGGPPASDR